MIVGGTDMTVGEKIKAVRKYLGLKQDEFAVKIGSSSNLACVETGKVTPTSMMLICIALTFNVDREWLTDESADTSEVLDHLVDTSIIDKYKRLKKNYRDFAERQLDMLLELQEKET